MKLLAQVRKTILLFKALFVQVLEERRKPKAAEETDQPEGIVLRVNLPFLKTFWFHFRTASYSPSSW